MSAIMSQDLAEAVLSAFKDELDDGFIYIFAGSVPASPHAALNMATDHTQVARLTVDGDGSTGLTLAAPNDHTITKNPSENWRGLVAFDGADDGETSLAPTFFRFCPAADDGRGAATTSRLQGTVGGPNANVNLNLLSETLTDNGTNETGAAGFTFSLSPFPSV